MAFLAFGLVVYRFIEIMMWTPEHQRHEGCCQRSCQLCGFVQDAASLHVRFLRNGSQISCVKLNLMMTLVKKKVGFVALHQLYFRVWFHILIIPDVLRLAPVFNGTWRCLCSSRESFLWQGRQRFTSQRNGKLSRGRRRVGQIGLQDVGSVT